MINKSIFQTTSNCQKLLLVSLMIMAIFINKTYSFAQTNNNETCNLIGETCIEGAETRNINGQPFYKPCWKYQITYHCYQPEIDYCASLKTAGCEQLNSICTATDVVDGKCNNYKNTYRCSALLANSSATSNQNLSPIQSPNITLIATAYNITKDYLDYSKCEGRDVLPNCSIVGSVCKQPNETKNINGKDITKACWQFENTYSCIAGGNVNSCINIPDYCQYSSSQCLSQTGNLCVHTQKTYLCSQSQPITPDQMRCSSNVYCLNGQCEKVEDNHSNDFAISISYLAAINESKDNNGDPGNLKIFTGNSKNCGIKAGGYNNCCKDQGWGQDIGASCSSEEIELGQLQAKKQCHYVGSYCSKKAPFGICLKTTKSSCCFNSKLSRVIIEQGRVQLGIGWGSAQGPNCSGLSPEQLQSLKFDQMDFSEISADITNSAVVLDAKYLEDKAKESINRLSATAKSSTESTAKTTTQGEGEVK